MRMRGGRLNWKGWLPHTGMVGVVVHIWTPNNPDVVCRSIINRDLYLIEIGEYYVPVAENGLRPFKQIADSNQKDIDRTRRNSLQRELLEIRQLQQQLTPILGSSLESPTSQLAATGASEQIRVITSTSTSCAGTKAKIQAVSSSSSEDESDLLRLEMQRHENFLSMWKQITEKKDKDENEEQGNKEDVTEDCDGPDHKGLEEQLLVESKEKDEHIVQKLEENENQNKIDSTSPASDDIVEEIVNEVVNALTDNGDGSTREVINLTNDLVTENNDDKFTVIVAKNANEASEV